MFIVPQQRTNDPKIVYKKKKIKKNNKQKSLFKAKIRKKNNLFSNKYFKFSPQSKTKVKIDKKKCSSEIKTDKFHLNSFIQWD